MGDSEINLATLIQDQADANPDAVAVMDKTRDRTYGVFAKAINDLARALAAEGVGPSIEVGIDVATPYDHWLVILAVMRLGGVSVTLLARGGMERAQQVDLDLILSTNPSSGFKTAGKKFIYADNHWIGKALREAKNIALPRSGNSRPVDGAHRFLFGHDGHAQGNPRSCGFVGLHRPPSFAIDRPGREAIRRLWHGKPPDLCAGRLVERRRGDS